MSTADVIDFFVDDTIKMCYGVFLLVCSYKLYKLKCDSSSSCGKWFTFHGSNPGGNDEVLESAV